MIRNWIICALSCLLVAGLSVNALAGDGPGGDGSGPSKLDTIETLLKQLTTKMDALEADRKNIELNTSDIRRLRERLDAQERKLSDLLARLEQIERSGPPNTRIAGAYVPPETGRLNLVNSWDSSVTYYINGRPFVVPARQSMTVEQPSGLFSYDIVAEGFGVIDSRRNQDLRAGQSLTMQVYPR